MSQMGQTLANDLLEFLLNSVDLTNAGGESGGSLDKGTASGAMTTPNAIQTVYLALHTAFVAPGGSQTTSEVNTTQYQGYTRKAVSRGTPAAPGTQWTFTNGAGDNVNIITWDNTPGGGSTGATATHISIGRDQSGAGVVLGCFPLIASGATYKVAYCTTTGTSNVFTSVAHGIPVGTDNSVQCYSVYRLANSPPTGAVEGTRYYAEHLTVDTFRLHAATGGTPDLNVSTLGSLLVVQAAPLTIAAGFTPTIAVGNFDLALE